MQHRLPFRARGSGERPRSTKPQCPHGSIGIFLRRGTAPPDPANLLLAVAPCSRLCAHRGAFPPAAFCGACGLPLALLLGVAPGGWRGGKAAGGTPGAFCLFPPTKDDVGMLGQRSYHFMRLLLMQIDVGFLWKNGSASIIEFHSAE